MAEANQNHNVDGTNLSMQGSQNPSKVLQKFFPEKPNHTQFSMNSEQLDLNLKLSLGLPYCQRREEKTLTRSSSIGMGTKSIAASVENEPRPQQDPSFLSSKRSSSLPVKTKKGTVTIRELLKRKGVESARRLMLAKERLAVLAAANRTANAVAAAKEVAVAAPNQTANAAAKELVLTVAANPAANAASNATDGKEKFRAVAETGRGTLPSEMVAWAAASVLKSAAFSRAMEKIKQSQGIVTGNSAYEGKCFTSQTPPSTESMLITKETRPAESNLENPAKKAKELNSCIIQDDGLDLMKKMPSVSTTGGSPNGRRIEGFLYKYLKGYIRIVCVCHGNFLTPEEFVKHAGGKDVTNPMRQIKVCSTSISF
ncbi:Ninja family [Quillaja saponaria]|uniref:Ninja-family protein n=1 Tax=Quillaja saponaria TaxID=32244 RepID=A0AAD7QC21_QUISA|nr:Ninja family [Quillaja saponaria]